MKIKTLYYRRGNNRITSGGGTKSGQVAGRLFAADSFDSTFKGVIDGKVLEPWQRRGAAIEGNAGQFANANLRVLQRCRLGVQPKVKTVRMIILVDENLRTFFRRNRLLNRVRENLPEGKAGCDIHVGCCQEPVRKVVDRVDIKAGSALVRMFCILSRSEDAIEHSIETHVEERSRVGARSQIAADANASRRKQITAQSKIRRASQRLIVSVGNPKAFRS